MLLGLSSECDMGASIKAQIGLRRASIVLASALVHGAVLLLILRSGRTPGMPMARPMEVSIFPPLAPAASRTKTSPSLTKPIQSGGHIALAYAVDHQPVTAPADLSGRAATSGSDSQGPAAGPVEAQDGVRRALSALLSCQPDRLKQLEPAARAACDAELVGDARTAPAIDIIPAQKREYYDAVVATRDAPTTRPNTRHGPTGVWSGRQRKHSPRR